MGLATTTARPTRECVGAVTVPGHGVARTESYDGVRGAVGLTGAWRVVAMLSVVTVGMAGCEMSQVDPDAEVHIRGTLVGPDRGPVPDVGIAIGRRSQPDG